MSNAVIILEEEPLSNAFCKWAGWMAVMIVFVMCLIYFSNYFARGNEECFVVDEYNSGHPVQDLKNKKWRKRFEQMDKLTYL